jgi:hypothetical protein
MKRVDIAPDPPRLVGTSAIEPRPGSHRDRDNIRDDRLFSRSASAHSATERL